MNMTQNIDDLEVKAGLPLDKVIQAHGHTREAHCTECKKEQDILKWKELADKEEPMFCSSCEKGIVKPDIIFFGEQLPERFFSAPKLVGEADLVFVIGTSLRVAPFSYLATLVSPNVPIVLINREDVIPDRDYKLFLEGDIQETIKDLMNLLGWL
jgi:NAD+-dependent protein deacetylase SIR2